MIETKKKILMIGLTPPLEGGSQQHIYEISKRLEGDVDVLTQKGSICKNKIEINYEGHIMFALAVYIWAFIHLIFAKKRYDTIHIHENTLYFLAPLLFFRYKIVVTVHGLKGFKFYDNKILWFLFSSALEYSDKLIAVNLEDQKLLWKFDNVYIPNGVDLSLYHHNQLTPWQVDNKIVYIGRIHEQKGVDILLEAFCKMNNPDNPIYLKIIGDDISDYAFKLKKEYYECHYIKWYGKINDREQIAMALESAYMIVLPSRFEGLPLTLFESLASGRPVIVSDIPAFKSVVTDNKNAILFKSEDAEDLKQKIFKVLNDSIFAEEIGKEGKKLAQNYDWNMIADQTRKVYG